MSEAKTGNYIQWNNANLDDLQPLSKLYRFEGELGYVAHIGNNYDWAVYKGYADCTWR
ncbi:MAG: hypothetical protein KME52_18620 [Desmonostoc geniculatum HA4340-LM1]|jgi:hypothetical protein|nr:hypothetical protein [Desmonostoc geniculatum HA4340-LM1]